MAHHDASLKFKLMCRLDGLDDVNEDSWFEGPKASPQPNAGRDDWFGSRSPRENSDSRSRAEPESWFGKDAR